MCEMSLPVKLYMVFEWVVQCLCEHSILHEPINSRGGILAMHRTLAGSDCF